ncbi:hypothetical protein L6R29_21305 [Myxococcota bacterium]|nr:hypothetical protein [Myxococcota bacterium]
MSMISPFSPIILMMLFSLLVPEQVNQPAPPPAEMYRYIPQGSQFCISFHTAPLAKDFFQRLQSLEKNPLFALLPRNESMLQHFTNKLTRARQQIQRETGKDFFSELRFATLCLRFQGGRTDLGAFHIGIPYSLQEYTRFAQKNANTEIATAHGFHIAVRPHSRESLVLTPENELLLLHKDHAQALIKQGPSALQNQAMQRLLTRHHRSEQLAAFGLIMDNNLQQILQQSAGMVTNLFQGWRSFHASTSLTHLKAHLHTTDAETTRRSALFLKGLQQMGSAAVLYGQGLFHGLTGILDMPNPEQRSPMIRKLVQNKHLIFGLMRTYLGDQSALQTRIHTRPNHLIFDAQGPLNRIWTLLGYTLVAQAI